jgi:hypothetical protein
VRTGAPATRSAAGRGRFFLAVDTFSNVTVAGKSDSGGSYMAYSAGLPTLDSRERSSVLGSPVSNTSLSPAARWSRP